MRWCVIGLPDGRYLGHGMRGQAVEWQCDEESDAVLPVRSCRDAPAEVFGERLDVRQAHATRGTAVAVVLRRVAGAEDLLQAAQWYQAARVRDF